MSTASTAIPARAASPGGSAVSFGGILRSEAIKLFSLRSTIWCLAIIFVVPIGLAFLLAGTVGDTVGIPQDAQQSIWVQSATLGIGFSQLVVAVLGVLVITGEYSTGMIRSTLVAVPRRIPALLAKALVIGAVTFLVALASILAAAFLPLGLLASSGVQPDLGDPAAWWAFLGGAGYLALLSTLALAIGTIVRNSAGGIAAVLGLLLVLPTVLQILVAITGAEWARNVGTFLPDSAGGRMFAYVTEAQAAPAGVLVLEPWQGLLVLSAWVTALLLLAALLLKRRDA
ncbi:ABC transporter permease subunit [Planctomonas psychrotolerans]|uniref:ABC transporter permease subunit n=1 Tax=Planctomonas psychrotolerans TaxID=2528712 RepID=UPI0012398EF6|nr:ABC transporter permease subunit [Planctomonas psychrotolerans]